MKFDYDYGPEDTFKIRHIGEMLKHNGTYLDMNYQGMRLEQHLCHMIYQIRDEIKAAPGGFFPIEELMVHYIHGPRFDIYSVYVDGMTAFTIYETGHHQYDFEFLSPNQCQKLDPLLNYATKHADAFGRAV